MSAKFFPIITKTACALKWSWTTLYLNSGYSRTCHRTTEVELTPKNFYNFHNNSEVLEDRRRMLKGEWPESNCSYCRNVEEAGGTSDRMVQLGLPGHMPPELLIDPSAVEVSPTIVEVYFDNTCNLGCLYCSPKLSSTISQENKKFGDFEKHGIKLQAVEKHFKNLVPYFWEWFDNGFQTIERLHVLGGEPLLQREFDILLDKINENPNPTCVLNIVTNLMIPTERLDNYVQQFKQLILNKKIKRIDITCSIDCWGPEQEYVRWGMDLEKWENNFKYLLEHKWLTLNVNQTISSLTIKTMPIFLEKLVIWKQQRKIGHWFSGVSPEPTFMTANIFGDQEFAQDYKNILKLMPQNTDEEKTAHQYMSGILTSFIKSTFDRDQVRDLIVYLDEKDRRRNTDWETVFPWLIRYREICGIAK
jgi:pyruvate-formate lyase-activating enzyme